MHNISNGITQAITGEERGMCAPDVSIIASTAPPGTIKVDVIASTVSAAAGDVVADRGHVPPPMRDAAPNAEQRAMMLLGSLHASCRGRRTVRQAT